MKSMSLRSAASLLLLSTLSLAVATPLWAAERPAALDRPALQSAKALNVALLATTVAGKRVLAAGERGVVVYSDDKGKTWKQAQVPTSASITALQFVDEQQGWAVGHMGVVLHTVDGGKSWERQFDGVVLAQKVLESARASGDARSIAEAERLLADGADKPIFDLQFFDAHTGFIVGAYNLILRTTDGGANWTPWQSHLAKVNPKSLHLYGVRSVGGILYIVGEQGLMLRSDDAGSSFEAIKSPYVGTWFGLAPVGNGVVAFGLRGNAWRSIDRGRSWHKLPTGVAASISAGVQAGDGRLVLASQAGDILVSSDQGDSFVRVPGAEGQPLAGVAVTSDGFVVTGLRGVQSVAATRK